MGQLVEAPFQLASGIISGNAADAQGKAKAAEIARDAKLAGIQATEQMASRIEDLQRTIGGIRSLAAQRGYNPNDPSAIASQDAATRFSDINNQRAAFNARQGASAAALAAQAARSQGTAAMWSSYLGGAGNFLKATDSYFAPKGSSSYLGSKLGIGG